MYVYTREIVLMCIRMYSEGAGSLAVLEQHVECVHGTISMCRMPRQAWSMITKLVNLSINFTVQYLNNNAIIMQELASDVR